MSVRKREWTTKAGPRVAWLVDYRDGSGRRRFATFDKKKDADKYHAEVNVAVGHGNHVAPSQSITLREAGAKWLEHCEAAGLEEATIASYRQHVDLHMTPYLGNYKLTALTTGIVRQFQDDLRNGKPAPGENTGTKRSPDMVKRVTITLGTLLADMVERGLAAQNVVRSLRRHRSEARHQQKLRVGVEIPTPEEIGTLLGSLKDDRWRPLLITAVYTGLRASELRGLRWSDVELDKRELHVHQRADRKRKVGPPKSKTSRRDVPLPPLVVNTLREWKLRCPKGELVFANSQGRVEDMGNFAKRGIARAMIAAGLTRPVVENGQPVLDDKGQPKIEAKYSAHALRHFFASWCANHRDNGGVGLSPKEVQELMGHSSIVVTMDRYGHLFPRGDDARRALEKAAERLATLRVA